MAPKEPLNKESVLSPALANAALLIAAPSLGCINTFTKTFMDLCTIYDLHVPDLEHILQYGVSPLSEIRSSKTSYFQKQTQIIPNNSETLGPCLEIKTEPEDTECDAVKVKQEIVQDNKAIYNVSIYDTRQSIQDTSLDNHVKKEDTHSEIGIDYALEIPLKMKDKSHLLPTDPSTSGNSPKNHVKYEDEQLEIPNDTTLKTPLKRKAESNIFYDKQCTQDTSLNKRLKKQDKQIGTKLGLALDDKDLSKVPIKNQVATKSQESSHQMSASNEGQPKMYRLKGGISHDTTHAINIDPYSTMVKDISKSLTNSKSPKDGSLSSMLVFSPKTNEFSFLDNTGKKRYAPSNEDAIKEMGQYGMPFKYAKDNVEFGVFKDCLLHVDTIVKDSRPSTLHIWFKDEGYDFVIPYASIREITRFKKIYIKVCYLSYKSIEHFYICTQGTKSRSKKVNNAATICWLQRFLGYKDVRDQLYLLKCKNIAPLNI